ncbi:hypothetical protein [Hydrogenimonas sp.]
MLRLKKEVAIFLAIFVILALAMHFGAWIHHPLQQIEGLKESPMGPWHPLFLTLGAYLVVLVFRLLLAGVKRIFSKKG